MTATAPAARDLLVEARTLIARPEASTQGAAARDADGEPVGGSSTRMPSRGVLPARSTAPCTAMRTPWTSAPPLQRARDQAGTILTDTVRALTLGHYTEATTYNDAPNHGCIVHAFDIAIADADRHCGKHSTGRATGTEYAR